MHAPPTQPTYTVSAEVAHENIEDELARNRAQLAQLRTVVKQPVVPAEPVSGVNWTNRRRILVVAVVALTLIVVAVILGVVFAGKDDNQKETTVPTASETTSLVPLPTTIDETIVPSVFPSVREPSAVPSIQESRLDLFQNFLEDFSDPKEFQNTSSPQYKALTWIATEDLASVDPVLEPQKAIERYVLAVLYYATDGEGWNPQYDFLTFRPVCAWNGANTIGVYCDDDQNVADIDLSFDLFRGTLPSELQHLTTLTNLRFFSHFGGDDSGPTTRILRGTIPTELGVLTRLTYLEMRSNQLSGTLPSELGSLSLLTHLSFESNSLRGTVPPEIGELSLGKFLVPS